MIPVSLITTKTGYFKEFKTPGTPTSFSKPLFTLKHNGRIYHPYRYVMRGDWTKGEGWIDAYTKNNKLIATVKQD